MRKKIGVALFIIGIIFIFDQYTKWLIEQSVEYGHGFSVIDGFFNIVHARNKGAAWSLLSESQGLVRIIFLNLLPFAVCGYFFYRIFKMPKMNLEYYGFSLIVGGALGNLYDRVVKGEVVDFLDFHLGASHFPSFNVADSAVTVGACFFILYSIFYEKKEKKVEA